MQQMIAKFRRSDVEIPFSFAAAMAIVIIAATSSSVSYLTNLRFAPFQPLLFFIVGALLVDLVSRLSGSALITRVAPTMMYGVLYLAMMSFFAVTASYATQRLDFPLRDDLFQNIDRAMGFNWMGYVTYIDAHPVLAMVTRLCYHTMSAQMAVPIVVFAYLSKHRELRVYLAAITMSLVGVIFIAMLLPAFTPLLNLDKSVFHNIRFSGATPVHELLKLRGSAPLYVNGDFSGVLSFPSFHAVVGIMIPLVLRRTKLFVPLVLVNIALLSGTVTEGGHYFCDIVSGGVLALLCYLAADRLQALEESRRRMPDVLIAADGLALPIPAE